jgi:hypothetical protein
MLFHPLIQIGIRIVWNKLCYPVAGACDYGTVRVKFHTHIYTSIRRRLKKALRGRLRKFCGPVRHVGSVVVMISFLDAKQVVGALLQRRALAHRGAESLQDGWGYPLGDGAMNRWRPAVRPRVAPAQGVELIEFVHECFYSCVAPYHS